MSGSGGIELTMPFKGTATTAAAGTQPDGTARLIIAANPARVDLVIYNNGSVTTFLGPTNAVTTATGIPLAAGAVFVDDTTAGAWYGITTGATATIAATEVAK